jgi:hypothetical protein
MEPGSAGEQKQASEGIVEAGGRSENNPAGGRHDLKKGLRGRLGMYISSLMEKLDLTEVTHEVKRDKMRAL